MTDDEKDALIRRYAAGDIAWSTMRTLGLDNFAEVLDRLGRLGLRYPIADMTGPNVQTRLRGIAYIRAAAIQTRPAP